MSIKYQLINDPKSVYEIDRKLSKFHLQYVPKTPLGPDFKPAYCVLPEKYALIHDQIRHFKVRPDDVWLGGSGKSGTTWAQEMVWLINNNLDYETAKSKNLMYDRFLLIENDALKANETELLNISKSDIDVLNELPSPRHIKCHLPLAFFPEEIWDVKPKIIYVIRNPKDAAISYYHHMKNIRGYKYGLSDFLHLYLTGQVMGSPYFDHVMDFWKIKHLDHLCIITYEDMKRDLRMIIQKVATFLNKSLTADQIDTLYDHLQIDSMRKNPSCNFEERIKKSAINQDFKFIRRGVANAYKDEMPQEWIDKFDKAIHENMKGCDLYF